MVQFGERVGPFEVVQHVGRGHRTSVWRAVRRDARRQPIHVELFVAEGGGEGPDAAALEALRVRYEALKLLQDERIPPPVAFYPGHGALVLPWVRAAALRDVLALARGGRLDLDAATSVDVLVELAYALRHAHAVAQPEGRIVHGALAPEVVALTAEGSVVLHGLADADPIHEWPLAPEQQAGVQDARTDQWLLGALGLELFRHDPSMLADTAGAPVEGVFAALQARWPALTRVLARLLAEDPAERYDGEERLIKDLLALGRVLGGSSRRVEVGAKAMHLVAAGAVAEAERLDVARDEAARAEAAQAEVARAAVARVEAPRAEPPRAAPARPAGMVVQAGEPPVLPAMAAGPAPGARLAATRAAASREPLPRRKPRPLRTPAPRAPSPDEWARPAGVAPPRPELPPQPDDPEAWARPTPPEALVDAEEDDDEPVGEPSVAPSRDDGARVGPPAAARETVVIPAMVELDGAADEPAPAGVACDPLEAPAPPGASDDPLAVPPPPGASDDPLDAPAPPHLVVRPPPAAALGDSREAAGPAGAGDPDVEPIQLERGPTTVHLAEHGSTDVYDPDWEATAEHAPPPACALAPPRVRAAPPPARFEDHLLPDEPEDELLVETLAAPEVPTAAEVAEDAFFDAGESAADGDAEPARPPGSRPERPPLADPVPDPWVLGAVAVFVAVAVLAAVRALTG